MARGFIQSATHNAHGQFREAARHAGMTTAAYANYVMAHKDHFSPKKIKQASLARTLRKLSKRRK